MKSVLLTTVAPLANDRVLRFDGPRPFLPTGGLDADGNLITQEVTFEGRPSRADIQVRSGDVCFARMQATLKVLQCRERDENLVLSTGFAVLRPDPKCIDSRFLYHYLRSRPFQSAKDRLCSGATQRAITNENIRALSVPLLSLSQQSRVVAVLDDADRVKAKRRAALRELDALLESVFVGLFGDPISNSHRLPLIRLTDFFHFRTGKLDSNAAVPDGRYPFFTCSRQDLRIDEYAFDCEALLLSGNNASADYSVKHYGGKFNAYQRTYVVTLKDSANSYAYARIALERQLSRLKLASKGTNTKYLTLEIFSRLTLPVPPLQEQYRFASFYEQWSQTADLMNDSLGVSEDLFESLEHRVFGGGL